MSSPVTIRTESGYKVGNLTAEKLPPRQALTLLFAALGLSEKQSAQAQQCSVASVKQAKQALFCKLNANSSADAITKAFANAYLRFASVLMAIFIAISSAAPSDHQNQIARTGRPRPANQQRTRTRSNGRTNGDGGIYWVPGTNELVWS